jgi:chromosomal replication initiation ATPase DnaA
MKNQEEILEFLREVQRVILKHGIEKVIFQLKKLKNDSNDIFKREICEYILNQTSLHYKVPMGDILISRKRGVLSEARRMCFALMKEHLSYTDEEIGDLFGGRSRQYVNKELISLPLNQDVHTTKQEVQFVNDFMILTKSVVDFKNNYIINNKNIE